MQMEPPLSSSFLPDPQPHSENSDSETRNGIFILSGSRLIRETLATSLRQRLNPTQIHCVDSFAEAVERVDTTETGLALIDATSTDGLAATRWLSAHAPATRLIAFNMDDAAQDVVTWTKVGIVTCVSRSAGLGEIIERIVTVIGSETNGLTMTLFPRNTQAASSPLDGPTHGLAGTLTAREEEVVRLIVAGESNKDIARLLSISVPTVKSHVHNLLVKLGLQRRGKLALRYTGAPIAALPHPADRSVNEGAAARLADPVIARVPPS
jgi:two-component system, NarL family, nitrate/nitrite response regulator NarL